MSSVAHLSQDSSLRGVEIEKKSPEEVVVQHQLLPRARRHVSARAAAGQRNVFHPVPGYPGASARRNVAQTFVVARRHIVYGLRDATAGLLRRRVRVIRALQIHVSDAAAPAEDVRHAFHNTGLSAA